MSQLSNEANELMYLLLKQMKKMAEPPCKFHPGWRFVSDDEDDLPEDPPDEPYDLAKLTEWAEETLSRGNRFLLWNYQLKYLSGQTITYHYDEGQDPVAELKSFFSSNTQWSLKPGVQYVRLDFIAKKTIIEADAKAGTAKQKLNSSHTDIEEILNSF